MNMNSLKTRLSVLSGAILGVAAFVFASPALAYTDTTVDYTASISAGYHAFVDPLVTGSWHYLIIVMSISAGFAVFYFAWHKFRGLVNR